MIRIRKNCFETNSSSTHALIIDKEAVENYKIFQKDLKNACWINPDATVIPFTSSEVSQDPLEIITPIDKLRYLYTALIQSNSDLEHSQVIIALKNLFPKMKFLPANYDYVIEDAEWLEDTLINKFTQSELEDFILEFLCFGKAYICERDYNIEFNDDLYEQAKQYEKNVIFGG